VLRGRFGGGGAEIQTARLSSFIGRSGGAARRVLLKNLCGLLKRTRAGSRWMAMICALTAQDITPIRKESASSQGRALRPMTWSIKWRPVAPRAPSGRRCKQRVAEALPHRGFMEARKKNRSRAERRMRKARGPGRGPRGRPEVCAYYESRRPGDPISRR